MDDNHYIFNTETFSDGSKGSPSLSDNLNKLNTLGINSAPDNAEHAPNKGYLNNNATSGSSDWFINATIGQAKLVKYDELFHQKPRYFIQLLFQGIPANIWVCLEEKQYKKSKIIEAISRELNLLGYMNIFSFNMELGEAKCGSYLIGIINKKLQLNYVNYYGGWDLHCNPPQYHFLTTDQGRFQVRQRCVPSFYPAIDLSFSFSSLQDAYSKIYDKKARLTLFLYLHYCLIYTLFSGIFFRPPFILNLCLPGDARVREDLYKSLFVGNQVLNTEAISLSDSLSEIRRKLLLAKDIPILLKDSQTVTRMALNSKLNFICELIEGRTNLRQKANGLNMPLMSVPILLSENIPDLNDTHSCVHVVLNEADFSNSLLDQGLYWSYHIQYFCSFISNNFNFLIPWKAKFQSSSDNSTKLLNILQLMYNLLKYYINSVHSNISLDQYFGFNGDVTDFLGAYISESFYSRTDYSEDFIQTFFSLQASDRLLVFNHPLEKDLEKCPYKKDLDEACVFSDGQSFWLTKKAFEEIVQDMARTPKQIAVLKSLEEGGKLGSKRVNNNSYLNKISVHLKDGSTQLIYVYELTNITRQKDGEDLVAEPITGRSFCFGATLGKQKNSVWNFDSGKMPNRHMLVSGKSGSGKTFLLNKLVQQAKIQNIPTYYFHLQGELSDITGDCEVIKLHDYHCSINIFHSLHGDVVKRAAEFAGIAKKVFQLSGKQETLISLSGADYLSGMTDTPSLFDYLNWFKTWCDVKKETGYSTEA